MPHDLPAWRGLEELLDTPAFRESLGREFPAGAAELEGSMDRRAFVQLLGASLALAGLGACVERPRERILPYVDPPPEVEPGRPRWYATTMTVGGYGIGLLAESHVGRPTKMEGNPNHPASLGSAGVLEQASILQLYDPQRARRVRHGRTTVGWSDFAGRFTPAELRKRAGAKGAGLRLLLEPTASPAIASMLERLRDRYPEAGVHFYSPLGFQGGSDPTPPLYDFSRADVVLALDADFLAAGPFRLRYARQFAERRRPAAGSAMNRLYVVESALTITGANADHRFRVRPSEIEPVLAAVALEVARAGRQTASARGTAERALARFAHGEVPEWIVPLARDLVTAGGRALVVVGEGQPAWVRRLAGLINHGLGSSAVEYIKSPLVGAAGVGSDMGALADATHAGDVGTLVMLETNPCYSAPADLEFSDALRRVPETVAFDLFEHETGRTAEWFLPAAHYLESWGDARAYDGTASLVQPLITPLYGGRTIAEILELLAGGTRSAHEIVRRQWDGDEAWDEALRRGIIAGSAARRVTPAWSWESLGSDGSRAAVADGLEIVFQQDPCVYDGRFSNNAWLQEMPDPVTKLTWGNAALLSPATAAQHGIETADLVRLTLGKRELTAPALVLPGMADSVVALGLGYGRGDGDEAVAAGVGVSAYRLWDSGVTYAGSGLTLTRISEGPPLAVTQTHWSLEGRPVARHTTLSEYRRDPEQVGHQPGRRLTLYEGPRAAVEQQWAMTVDLGACTGCSACVVACQAENNVPVVGPEGVRRSREMHWLRVDRYFVGSAENPQVLPQPMLCQHCEQAPCEYVCPVNATLHSPDGLNEMVYNRCVGTRFCSNNCPYKVRRFNWFDYNHEVAETVRMARNPEVTVRARGVMEKCTFCVQRIRRAQIDARIEGRALRDGEVRTACQQACPSDAIAFGSLSDPEAEVVRRRGEPRAYAALHELGTEPRVRYLARITNPNPELANGGRGD